jgi:hypothetical protein
VSQVSGYDWMRQLPVGGVQGAGLALAIYGLCRHLARQLRRPDQRV